MHTLRLILQPLRSWPTALSALAALAALGLLWAVRRSPLPPLPFFYIDALGAFFTAATLGGLTLLFATHQVRPQQVSWRIPVVVALLVCGYLTALAPVLIVAFLLLAALAIRSNTVIEAGRLRWFQRVILAAPNALAGCCLLVGYSALALRGAIRLDDPAAGGGLDSFVFWFVLLAAAIPLIPLITQQAEAEDAIPRAVRTHSNENGELSAIGYRLSAIFTFAWFYPLARLYTLGPWNEGWSFATTLLGGSLALWAAFTAFSHPLLQARNALVRLSYLGLALTGLGLSTSAGIAACCYALLAYLCLAAEPANTSPNSLARWALSGALPFTAPFVAAWMLVGASASAEVLLLAGITWLIVLLNALAVALNPSQAQLKYPQLLPAAVSLVLGVMAPVVMRYTIQPVVEQLQGGLTPYGSLNIWPWVGLASADAGSRTVTSLPSIAAAGLMLVLTALVYLLARLRGYSNAAAGPTPGPESSLAETLHTISEQVPWLRIWRTQVPDKERRNGDH